MEKENHAIERFLLMSDLYFKLYGKTSRDIDARELEELFDAINDNSPSASPE